MMHYDRTDVSERVDLTKSNNSKECMICHCWFFNHGFKFQDYVCIGCHDLIMLIVNISDIVNITVKNVDYRCIIYNISKSEAINLLKNSVLENRGYISKNIALNFSLFKQFFFLFLFGIQKMFDIPDICKSSNISVGTVIRNPEC